jgi:hypothetical protein
MTREAFIKVLDEKGYFYEIEGNKIIVTHKRHVNLELLTSIPSVVEFRNEGVVNLKSLTSLPPGVEFKNGGDVYLRSLTSLPPGVEFNNGRDVYLESLIGVWFYSWEGDNIEEVGSNRLLNLMIKRGIFER